MDKHDEFDLDVRLARASNTARSSQPAGGGGDIVEDTSIDTCGDTCHTCPGQNTCDTCPTQCFLELACLDTNPDGTCPGQNTCFTCPTQCLEQTCLGTCPDDTCECLPA